MFQNVTCSKSPACVMVFMVCVSLVFLWSPSGVARASQSRMSANLANSPPPPSVVKLIFIHHSTGENWLSDDNGALGIALGNNNYFVSDTNYGWGPNSIGDRTDIPNWLEWFRSDDTSTYVAALYAESGQHAGYTRTLADPGGANEIIMFKSCFPNSALEGNPDDPPSAEGWLSVGHAKYVYNQLLLYFLQHPEKLFVVITAPPLSDATYAANARAFNQWLVNDWLSQNNYTARNVAVFDFYNVLTSNGGSATTNDLGLETGNHHRWWNGAVQHKSDGGTNINAYPSGDDHPSQAGNLKATSEFVPVLNFFYNRWKTGTYRLTVTVVSDNATKGGGSINNGTGLIACANTGNNPASATGSCQADLIPGTSMTLIQSPDSDSTPATWSGACVGTGSCELTNIAVDTATTATFHYSPMAKVVSSGNGYESLLSAYNNAASSDTIQTRAVIFTEGAPGSLVTLNGGKSIVLSGGLNANYLPGVGYTIIRNVLVIGSGRLTISGGVQIQ